MFSFLYTRGFFTNKGLCGKISVCRGKGGGARLMNFGGGGFGNDRQNRRDELEIGSDGRSTADRKRDRQREQQRDMQDMKSGKGFGKRRGLRDRFGRGRSSRGGYNNRRGNSRGGCMGSILGIILIIVPIVIVGMLFTGNLRGGWRSALSTPEQNMSSFYQGVFNVEQAAKDTYLDEDEKEEVSFYRKNMIGNVGLIDKQVYPEYLVFIHSSDEEKNRPFREYIEEVEERKDYPVPIYRISADKTVNYFVTDSLGEDEPGIAIYRNNTGDVTYDSVIGDPEHLGKLEEYMENILEEDDEFFKNNRGSYGEAEWLQHISDRVNPTPEMEVEEEE